MLGELFVSQSGQVHIPFALLPHDGQSLPCVGPEEAVGLAEGVVVRDARTSAQSGQ